MKRAGMYELQILGFDERGRWRYLAPRFFFNHKYQQSNTQESQVEHFTLFFPVAFHTVYFSRTQTGSIFQE